MLSTVQRTYDWLGPIERISVLEMGIILEELPKFKVKNKKVITNRKQLELKNKLIKFCIKHFDDYQPNYKRDC